MSEPIDDRRADRNNYEYDNRLKAEFEEQQERIKSDYEEQHQPPPQLRRTAAQHNAERVRIETVTINPKLINA